MNARCGGRQEAPSITLVAEIIIPVHSMPLSYTDSYMKRCLVPVLLFFVFLLPTLHAIEKQYQAGKIVDVQQKSRTRVLYYLVNTPVTQDDPYYEVSVQFRDMIYVGEYTPRHASDTLPEDWRVGSKLQARLDKHHMFVKGPGGVELDLIVIKRVSASPETTASDPVQK